MEGRKDLTAFQMKVAGLCVQVQCLHESTRRYCGSYLTAGETPWLEVTIGEADIEGERQRLLSKKDPGQPLEASTPQALEVLVLCRRIAEALPRADRVLFHGSCLVFDGQGVLFTAKSGTGKSTHTRLWRQVFGDRVEMVNDDKPFLALGPEGVNAHGTPWRGKHGLGTNVSVPLKAICYVTRGTENRVEPMTARELFPVLLQQTYSPDDPGAMLATLGLVERLSKTVALYKLTCNMDPQAALTAQAGIFESEEDSL